MPCIDWPYRMAGPDTSQGEKISCGLKCCQLLVQSCYVIQTCFSQASYVRGHSCVQMVATLR